MSTFRWRVLLVALGALLVLYTGVWSYRFAVAQFGPFAPLIAVLLLVLVTLLLGPWSGSMPVFRVRCSHTACKPLPVPFSHFGPTGCPPM